MESDEDVDIESDFQAPLIKQSKTDSQNLASHYGESEYPWLLEQNWSLDDYKGDKRSRVTQMIAEEQLLCKGIGERDEKKCVNISYTQTRKNSPRTWSEEETKLLLYGLEIYGKQWKKISELIPSRTYDQVKHHGISLMKKQNLKDNEEASTSTSQTTAEASNVFDTGKPTITVRGKKAETKKAVTKEILKASVKQLTDINAPVVRIEQSSSTDCEEVDVDVEEDGDSPVIPASELKESKDNHLLTATISKSTDQNHSILKSYNSEHSKSPCYYHIDSDTVTSKTPSSNVPISDGAEYKKGMPDVQSFSENDLKIVDVEQPEHIVKKRVRKVRHVNVFSHQQKEVEGRTIDHDKNEVIVTVKEIKPKKAKKATSSTYNPFKLVPCQEFKTIPEPFKVEIDIQAVLLMDVHSHLSKTEVIGLLGGDFTQGVLKVKVAEPCDSISTGMQCEMDPVSQTEAKEKIDEKGYRVVGWYHSHPSFDPNPSLRDIETQKNFQTWFSVSENVFIGIIINPYHPLMLHKHPSTIKSLMILQQRSNGILKEQPFAFNHTITKSDVEDISIFMKCIKCLLEKMTSLHNQVDMRSPCHPHASNTCLDKLCGSVNHYLEIAGLTLHTKENLLDGLKEMICQV